MIDENKYNLTPKQLLFCREYLVDMNATKACIRAGYSEKTARTIAAQNLSKLNIQECISDLVNNRFQKCNLKAEMVIEEYMKIAFSNIKDCVEIDGNNSVKIKSLKDMRNTAAISDIYCYKTGSEEKFKIKLHDKLHALDKLGDYLKLFKDIDLNNVHTHTSYIFPTFNNELVIDDPELLKKLERQPEYYKYHPDESKTEV